MPKKNLSKLHAINLGRFVTDKTRLASFRLIPSSLPIKNRFTKQVAAKKFRLKKVKSKLPYQTFVEKSKYRIDSPGEKRQITIKGLARLRSGNSIISRLSKLKAKKKSAKKVKRKKKRIKRNVHRNKKHIKPKRFTRKVKKKIKRRSKK